MSDHKIYRKKQSIVLLSRERDRLGARLKNATTTLSYSPGLSTRLSR